MGKHGTNYDEMHIPDLKDEDFCTLCGVCLPPQDRCAAHPEWKMCPHAEAAAAAASL